ncbi:hypothetical protein Lfu02_76920 [Longispora fulva]|uniref:transposase n=1 Tax=Longispora fulva TaxID=619741 RepID=UPI0019412C99|nr:transposase [Longispora fulva]GIG63320.1 hypothetical protein Lfu02_76920 [Longispora fulva]
MWLPAWLDAAGAVDLPDLRVFVTGVRRALTAVTNGLTLRWSSGAVEGTVGKLKAIKSHVRPRQLRPTPPENADHRVTRSTEVWSVLNRMARD